MSSSKRKKGRPKKNSNANQEEQYTGTDWTEPYEWDKTGLWTAEVELVLFDAVEKYPPIGLNKYFNLLSLRSYLSKRAGVLLECEQIWLHLSKHYNMRYLAEEDRLEDSSGAKFKLPRTEEFCSLMYSPFDQEPTRSTTHPGAQEDIKPKEKKRKLQDRPQEEVVKKQKENTSEKKKETKTEKTDKKVIKRKQSTGSQTANFIKKQKKLEQMDQTFNLVMKKNSTHKFANFAEFIYGALKSMNGVAELSFIYEWVQKNWKKLDNKCMLFLIIL
ncbi:hypothetical protein QOT17_003458 [Balamuthia mandrillaris]